LHGKPELLTPIFLGPRSARDIDIDFAMQFILPYQLTDGQRVLLDYGRVPLGKEAEIKISETELYVECTLVSPEKASFDLTFLIICRNHSPLVIIIQSLANGCIEMLRLWRKGTIQNR
jgi:hypothetical protein